MSTLWLLKRPAKLVMSDITGVMPTLAAVSTVQLSWRVMFNAVQQTPMFDDGQHGDGAAGDGSYGVILPKSAYTQGQLVRWYFTATDVDGNATNRVTLAGGNSTNIIRQSRH